VSIVKRIYFDNAATTPVDPEVAAAMEPFLGADFGNPSSVHESGQRARAALDDARDEVAALIGASPSEVVFTSGGTEANNLALFGLAYAPSRDPRRDRIITIAVEHHSVLDTCAALERRGFRVTRVPVDSAGLVDPAQVLEAVEDSTLLVSVMLANNEVGTIEPVPEIARACRARGVPVHTDAVQAAGKMAVDVQALGVDLLSLSAHKFCGPKGAGALFVRSGVEIEPIIFGGGQESGRRSGTENVAGIAGLGVAARVAHREMAARLERTRHLRDRLLEQVPRVVDGIKVTGHPEKRLPGIASFLVEGVEGESLLVALDLEGIAASSGSACSLGALEPSHVLAAMGFSPSQARSHLRLSVGHQNTEEEVERFLQVLPPLVRRLRSLSA
jgi:cysteine desulfurase